MILLGIPGVMPEWPLDQSYETAYAKMDPVRLNAVAQIGPGAGSNVLSLVLASLSQKCMVPSDPQVENVP